MVHFTFSNTIENKNIKVSLGDIRTKSPWITHQSFWHINSDTFFNRNENLERTSDEIITYIDSILTPIIQYYDSNYKKFNITYYINCETEILWLPVYEKIGILEYLKNKFKDRNLILLDANLSDVKYDVDIIQEGVGVFWGQSSDITHEFIPKQRLKFSKHFTCLQERETDSRNEIYYHLYENNLMYKTFYTYQQRNKLNRFHTRLDDTTNYSYEPNEADHSQINGKSVLFYPNSWYKSAFCNIVTESSFYPNDLPDTTPTKIFFTEKIEKCFTAGQPFILVGNRGSLKYLKKLGFKTFSNWWDESYDEESDSIRMKKIKDIITEIGSWSLDKCYQVYKEMIPILNHNQRINKKLFYSNSGPFFHLVPEIVECIQNTDGSYTYGILPNNI